MRLTTLFVACSFLFLAGKSQGQDYLFVKSTSIYEELVNPVSLNNGEIWEMPTYTIPIGFDFPFFDTTINTLYFFEEGSGSVLSSSNLYEGLHMMIMPYGAGLIDRGFGTGTSHSPFSYLLTGMAGDHILKIQWKNAGFASDIYENGFSTDYTNFQLWLYEKTGLIEMHYGPILITDPELIFGFGGPTVSLIPWHDYDEDTFSPESLWLIGSPANPSMIMADDFNFLDFSMSPSTLYTFTNLVVSTKDFPLTNLSVFPNPAYDVLNITLPTRYSGTLEINIYDITGRPVFSESMGSDGKSTQLSGPDCIQLTISNLRPGYYNLVLHSSKGIYISKFIKN